MLVWTRKKNWTEKLKFYDRTCISNWNIFGTDFGWEIFVSHGNTVKLVRAKLPANAGNFTCSSQVKRSLAQFICVTCSLPVNTSKFTCLEAASTSRRTHANCVRAHVNLPEYHRHFTGSFTFGTHANLPPTSVQNCLLLQAKIHATYRQKH